MDYTEEILKVLSTELEPYSTIDGQACIDGMLTSAHKLNELFQQKLKQCNVSGSLEFGKPQMSISDLEAKMKRFFDTQSTDELIERFEKLGYEFEPIDGKANNR